MPQPFCLCHVRSKVHQALFIIERPDSDLSGSINQLYFQERIWEGTSVHETYARILEKDTNLQTNEKNNFRTDDMNMNDIMKAEVKQIQSANFQSSHNKLS